MSVIPIGSLARRPQVELVRDFQPYLVEVIVPFSTGTVDEAVRQAQLLMQAMVDEQVGSKAESEIQIAAAGLATGGGDLTQNRTITVPKASQADAEVAEVDTMALTPLSGKQLLLAQLVAALEAIAPTLPTTLPATPGKLWLNGGVFNIS